MAVIIGSIGIGKMVEKDTGQSAFIECLPGRHFGSKKTNKKREKYEAIVFYVSVVVALLFICHQWKRGKESGRVSRNDIHRFEWFIVFVLTRRSTCIFVIF